MDIWTFTSIIMAFTVRVSSSPGMLLRPEVPYGRLERTIDAIWVAHSHAAARLKTCGLARRLCDLARSNTGFMPSHIKNQRSSRHVLHCRPGMQVAFQLRRFVVRRVVTYQSGRTSHGQT
jgi:hypothetical protein